MKIIAFPIILSNFASNNKHVKPFKRIRIMKSLGYIGAFLGGAVAGAVIGLLVAPESGKDTRTKVSDTVNDFLKKHNIRLSRKEVEDLVDDIQEVTPDE